MKILNLSLDSAVLNAQSAVAKRVRGCASIADRYDVVVPFKEAKTVSLHERVAAHGSGGGNKITQLWRLYRRGAALVREHGCDVVSVQDAYYVGAIAWLLARRHGCALEVQVHGFEKFGGLRKRLARFVVRRADAVRTVSERMKKRLVDEFGVQREGITVVPILVKIRNPKSEIRNKSKIRNSKSRKDERFIFLTVGRLVAVKNVGMQIAALAEVAKTHSNVELWIAGDGEEMQNLKEGMSVPGGSALGGRNEKLESKIKFLGWRDDLDEIYKQADCFVLTSNSEGWGMVVIEAAAHGLPVIMTDVGLAGEVIKDGESGLVIPVGDAGELASAMRRMIDDASLRERLAAGAAKAVKRLPSEAQTLALYRESWDNAVVRCGRKKT